MRNRFVPAVIVAIAVFLAAVIYVQDRHAEAQWEGLIRDENRIRTRSCAEHVRAYFEAVYSLLLFISEDDDVLHLRKSSRPYIQKLFEHGLEEHQLSEVYVVEAGFQGNQRPWLTFEHETESEAQEEIHTPPREQQEYQAQVEQLKRFGHAPSAKALLSPEISLCVPDETGGMSRGFVYSVPIRLENKLIGLVAGMLQRDTVLKVLAQGKIDQIAALVGQHGEVLIDENAPPAVRSWLDEQMRASGAGASFGDPAKAHHFDGWGVVSAPARIAAAERWWVVYFYRLNPQGRASLLLGAAGHAALGGSVLLAAIALASLVRTLNRRIEEQTQYLQQRKELERQIHEVSEREKRRLGEVLREDLCQRLTGVEAVTKVLEKKLTAAGLPEAGFASEVCRDVKGTLSRAREMADELQPVALLQDGLIAAMQELADRTTSRSGIDCRLEANDLPDIDESVGAHLYYIAQEALNNVVRHARARQAVIRIRSAEGRLELSITDDGCGIGAKESPRGGMGLRMVGYICDMIGAEFKIAPGPEKGTVVTCSLPDVKSAVGRI